jgi:hypothetical protein
MKWNVSTPEKVKLSTMSDRSDTEMVISYPTRGINVCLQFLCFAFRPMDLSHSESEQDRT